LMSPSPGYPLTSPSCSEYAVRRSLLGERLVPGSVVLLPAAPQLLVPGTQIPLPYRQEAAFFYLTGIYQESDLIACLEVNPTGEKVFYRLFVSEDDKERQRWEGPRLGVRDAKQLQADGVETLPHFPRYLEDIVKQNRPIIINSKMWKDHPYGKELTLAATLNKNMNMNMNPSHPPHGHSLNSQKGVKTVVYDTLEPALHALRWRKSPAEVEMMRKAANIATDAFKQCMRLSRANMNERELSSLFEFLCKVEGAQRMPYPQVVAGGNNACTIHYSNNNKKVFEGEMVLMDAGCDFFGYVSDITRTWPIGGKFTEPQREVYERVLETHQKCLELCVEGATLRDIHKTSVTLLSRALSKLGIVQKSTRDVIMQGLYKPYYPHSIGHWLGMDTHDVHTVSAVKPFEPGTVLTVEPGLYLPRNNHDIPAQYRGIGIRLEDDILVTEDKPEILSGALPITVEDVENIVGKHQDEEQGQVKGETTAAASAFPSRTTTIRRTKT